VSGPAVPMRAQSDVHHYEVPVRRVEG